MKSLINIQRDLKAPKMQFNAFGKYNYRSCEDILEALKPLLHREKCTLIISDEVNEKGGMVYIESHACFTDSEGISISVTACAGIPHEKKGMDLAQIFGASSSYARKYALNGLFLIDDNKDIDPDKKNEQGAEKPELKPGHIKWDGAKKAIRENTATIEAIRKTYLLTDENAKLLHDGN